MFICVFLTVNVLAAEVGTGLPVPLQQKTIGAILTSDTQKLPFIVKQASSIEWFAGKLDPRVENAAQFAAVVPVIVYVAGPTNTTQLDVSTGFDDEIEQLGNRLRSFAGLGRPAVSLSSDEERRWIKGGGASSGAD